MTRTAEYYIQALSLLPHPEGGYYKEVYRSPLTLPKKSLPADFTGDRAASTSIYFMLTSDRPSRFHKIRSDETWFFHDGASLDLHLLSPTGAYQKVIIGKDIDKGNQLQFTVSKNHWFAAAISPNEAADFALISCVVSPGFDFDDFELANQASLLALYPAHETLIRKLT